MPSPSATVPSTPDLSGPVMTAYIETSPEGDKMRTTLTRVIDPAQGAPYTTPDHGKHFRRRGLRADGSLGPVLR